MQSYHHDRIASGKHFYIYMNYFAPLLCDKQNKSIGWRGKFGVTLSSRLCDTANTIMNLTMINLIYGVENRANVVCYGTEVLLSSE